MNLDGHPRSHQILSIALWLLLCTSSLAGINTSNSPRSRIGYTRNDDTTNLPQQYPPMENYRYSYEENLHHTALSEGPIPLPKSIHEQRHRLQEDNSFMMINEVKRRGVGNRPIDMCLDYTESNDNTDFAIILSECSFGTSITQVWIFNDDGYIRSFLDDNLCIDGGKEGIVGNELVLAECMDLETQRWTEDSGRLVNQNHGKYIGVRGQCNSIQETESILELQDVLFSKQDCPSQQLWKFEGESDDYYLDPYEPWRQVDPSTHPKVNFHQQTPSDSLDYMVSYGDHSVSCVMDSSWSITKILVSSKDDPSIELDSFDARKWKCVSVAISGSGDAIVVSMAENNIEEEVNVARFGKASASSTFTFGNSSSRHRQYASYAIDGNTAGTHSFSLTNIENQPWWQVELASPALINRIVVYNREEHGSCEVSCLDRLNDSTITITNGDGEVLIERVITDSVSGPIEFVFEDIVVGSIVRIQSPKRTYLGLAEVSVFGFMTKDFGSNLALLGTASQSSTWSNYNEQSGSASYAIDGNTANQVSFSITELEFEPWWMVDLMTQSLIKMIIIHNRGVYEGCDYDNCVNRLDGSFVMILDSNGQLVDERRIEDSTQGPIVFDYKEGIMGAAIKVQSLQTTWLNLAEVEVFGVPVSPSNHTIKLFQKSKNSPTYEHQEGHYKSRLASSVAISDNGNTIAIGVDNTAHIISPDVDVIGEITSNSDYQIGSPLELTSNHFAGKMTLSKDGLLIAIASPDSVRYEMQQAGAITLFQRDDTNDWTQVSNVLYGTKRNSPIGYQGMAITKKYASDDVIAQLDLMGDEETSKKCYDVSIPRTSLLAPTTEPNDSSITHTPPSPAPSAHSSSRPSMRKVTSAPVKPGETPPHIQAVFTKTPTLSPTMHPSHYPSTQPSTIPSISPSTSLPPSIVPSVEPTSVPIRMPSASPTVKESSSPSMTVTSEPSKFPTDGPSARPTLSFMPSSSNVENSTEPSLSPSKNDKDATTLLTNSPTRAPLSLMPSNVINDSTIEPTGTPTGSELPTTQPTIEESTNESIQSTCNAHRQVGSVIDKVEYNMVMSNNGRIIAGSSRGSLKILKYQPGTNEWKEHGNMIDLTTLDQDILISLAGGGDTIAIKVVESDKALIKVFEFDSATGLWNQEGSAINYPSLSSCDKLTISSDGYTVTCNTHDIQISTYDESLQDWVQLGTIIETFSNVFDIDLSSDGRIVAICDHTHTTASVLVYRYDESQWEQVGEVIHSWHLPSAQSKGRVSISGDGLRVAIGSPGDTSLIPASLGEIAIYDFVEEGMFLDGWTRIFGVSEAGFTGISSLGEHVMLSKDGRTFVFDYEKSASEQSPFPSRAIMMLKNARKSYIEDEYYEDNFDWEVFGDEMLIQDQISSHHTLDSMTDSFEHKLSLSGDGNIVAVSSEFKDGDSRDMDSEDIDSSRIAVYQWCRYKTTHAPSPSPVVKVIPSLPSASSKPSISQEQIVGQTEDETSSASHPQITVLIEIGMIVFMTLTFFTT